eukprot:GHUV01027747.1.p1 GENE.GHUV01027747.1~~GHUV01027747.1.p1  ORF type:complete len:103 (-),score=5.08 GHUV01027747.1:146-454(-)
MLPHLVRLPMSPAGTQLESEALRCAYSATEDGWNPIIFHERVDGYGESRHTSQHHTTPPHCTVTTHCSITLSCHTVTSRSHTMVFHLHHTFKSNIQADGMLT